MDITKRIILVFINVYWAFFIAQIIDKKRCIPCIRIYTCTDINQSTGINLMIETISGIKFSS
jgi:hypothetical protein